MPDAKHIPDEHDALHDRAQRYLESAVRRTAHAKIPTDIVMRELIDILARVAVENETPLSEAVAEFIESYTDAALHVLPTIEVRLEPKATGDAN